MEVDVDVFADDIEGVGLHLGSTERTGVVAGLRVDHGDEALRTGVILKAGDALVDATRGMFEADLTEVGVGVVGSRRRWWFRLLFQIASDGLQVAAFVLDEDMSDLVVVQTIDAVDAIVEHEQDVGCRYAAVGL